MKQGKFTHANAAPLEIEIRNLYNDIYELSATDDVNLVEVERVDSDNESETISEYQYYLYFETVKADGYEEIVSALVELKYTHGDEISLMRKGMLGIDDEEYNQYLAYVTACKSAAKEYFGIE